jgi:alkylated DNA repair dioxygenase AlkB
MQQPELFSMETDADVQRSIAALNEAAIAAVHGLSYAGDFISEGEEADLLEVIDANPWSNELERRVQHYGYKYDYRSRRIDESMRVGAFPNQIQAIAKRLCAEGTFRTAPDQCIVNEYSPGQGIAPHIDCEPCFAETIVSLSLGSQAVMDFTHSLNGDRHPVWLERRSIVVINGAARYEWKHGIARRRKDAIGEFVVPRSRRVSLTFRNVSLA